MEKEKTEELYLVNYQNGGEYYEITCDCWLQDTIFQSKPPTQDELNLVDTLFSYRMNGVGFGAGGCSPVYSYDIKFLYDHLCLLKAGTINRFVCYFRNKSFYSGYYLKVKFTQKSPNHYEAYYKIYDNIDCVTFRQPLTKMDLDEQIQNLKACTEKFPVRSL